MAEVAESLGEADNRCIPEDYERSVCCAIQDLSSARALRSILGLRRTIALRSAVIRRWWSAVARLRRRRAVSSSAMLLRTPSALAGISHAVREVSDSPK